MRVLPKILLVGLALRCTAAAAQLLPEPGRLDQVRISGNHRVEEEAIRVQLRTRPGSNYDPETVDSDIRALYRMGFFDDVQAELAQLEALWVLTYTVAERPQIKEVRLEGNKKIDREDLENALKIRPHTILDPTKARRGIEEARKLYEKKGYLDAAITYATEPVGDNEVIVTLKVEEGKVIRVQKLVLEGARKLAPSTLKKVMQTKEEWLLSFLTGAGNLDREILKADTERITAYYYDQGYIDVRVDEPAVERKEDGLFVTIKIDEGELYTVGTVSITGDLIDAAETARKQLGLVSGETFRSSKLREDINKITEVYGDQGYAFVNVTPDTQGEPGQQVINVAYKVSRGPEVAFDKIEITGNTKTRDKVIRRELKVQEQERFSGSKLRKSQENLRRLGFFEDVNLTTRKAASDDRLDLLVDVKEGSTGTFSAGAGISSGESFLFNIRLSEINLFGRGQRLVLNTDFGSIRRQFQLSFTEPYFLDTELSLGVDLFNWEMIFEEFTRGGTGAGIRTLYPLTALGWDRLWGYSLEDTRLGLEYRIEEAEIKDVSTTAVRGIKDEEGSSLTSSVIPRVFRDTRNHPFDPTAGSLQDFSLELAGLGGESRFLKLESRLRWYYPFYKSARLGTFVFAPGATFGYGLGYGGGRSELPLFERYFPGGINSVRGYKVRSLGPREPVFNSRGQLVRRDAIGGSQELVFNEEVIFPIVEALGLKGVLFFDAGNAFRATDGIEFDDMRTAVGAGIRWLSPIGPLRIEVGFPLNPRVGDEKRAVLFSFGGPP
ncbi:MAG: outer membrane protein assembly factor BamA [Deltaproteobacteria bacterium]|nr:outer membrane protein assembly factor BamA [Deltaproteobacteria bacterium]